MVPNPATTVNLRNNDRAPLLLMAGGADHTVPVALVQEARKRHYKSTAVTDYKEFPGRPHFTVGVPALSSRAARRATQRHRRRGPGQV